jgi:hypothetical protein
LVFDDERDGMLRKDLFFLGTSVGFKTLCGDASFDVGIESALTVGGSIGAVVGSMELGNCEVSKALPCQKRGTKKYMHKVGVSVQLPWEMRRDRRGTYNWCLALRMNVARSAEPEAGPDRRQCCCHSCGAGSCLFEARSSK